MIRHALASALALGFICVALAPGGAQTIRRQILEPSPLPLRVATPVPTGPTHIASGTIVKMSGPILFVMLRNRRPLRVDASAAIASGKYSAPLFLGKVVIVEGRYGYDGTLFAITVTRLTHLDATAPLDR